MAKGYFFAKVVSRHEDEKMSNDFENSQEYRKALEIAKKQEELYKNVTKAISPEAFALFATFEMAPDCGVDVYQKVVDKVQVKNAIKTV